MNIKFHRILITLFFASMLLTACKKWDHHNALTDPNIGKDLLQQIQENGDLSTFANLLQKSGYDKLIASSKTYTVFAPVNAALASIDPTILADSSKLRMFVGNHISHQLYPSSSFTAKQRLQMLNGKYNNLQGRTIEEASITAADKYAKNGILHVVDKMIPALPNAWEFIETSPLAPTKQKNYLLSIFRNVFNPATAVQIGVDPNTGVPIYQPGTDSIRTNVYWHNVHDLRDEKKEYTFFALQDAGWDSEVNKYKTYFPTGTTDSTTDLASYEVVKDFAFEGVYTAATLPDTLLSKFNSKVGIDKSAIVRSVKLSNGIVHIVSKLEVKPSHKFQDIVIEGENYNFTRFDRRNNTYFRDKLNTLTGKPFRDVLVYGHGVSQFFLGYRLTNVPALKYKVYWVALHDDINGITTPFKQKIGIETFNSNTLPYVDVAPNVYDEVYLGEFTLTTFKNVLNVYLTADNTTTASRNILTMDYVRLEPAF